MLIVFCGYTEVGDIDCLKSFYAKQRLVYLLTRKGSDVEYYLEMVSSDARS